MIRSESNASVEQMFPELYDELRELAASMLRHEPQGHTLQPTALAHEAYLRLSQQRGESFRRRAYFMSSAADVIRRVLIDHARTRQRDKRGRGWTLVSLGDQLAPAVPVIDLLTLHDALDELRALNARHARVVELRFYGDLSLEEVGEVLGVSSRTVKSDWRTARAWLARRLELSEASTTGHP